MTQNPTCVKITRSIFMHKKTISFHAYQANRLEQGAENRCEAGIIIIESLCSSTEESDYKPLSYDSKAILRVAYARSRYSNRTVTLTEHSATFIIYSIIELYCIARYSVGSSATNKSPCSQIS